MKLTRTMAPSGPSHDYVTSTECSGFVPQLGLRSYITTHKDSQETVLVNF